MKNAPVQHRIEYACLRAAAAFILTRSHAQARRLGQRLGRLAYWLLGAKRRPALDNLALALPELGTARHREIVRACFEHYGAAFCEVVSAARLSREELLARLRVDGWENLERVIADGGRYFLMTGHLGNPDLAALYMGLRLGPLHAVVRPPDNPYVDRYLQAIRGRFGNQLIGKKGAGHRMLNAYRKGERVAIIIDQRVRPSAGIQVPFFGHPAWTSPVLAYLSSYTGAVTVPVYCYPEGEDGYLVRVRPPIAPAGRGPEAEAELTRCYLEDVEREIRLRPEMWLWMHRRWVL